MSLETLLHRADVWRGGAAPASATGLGTALPSGFDALDAQLPGGGLPRRALTEILLPREGIGELRFLLPLLARPSSRRPTSPTPRRSRARAWISRACCSCMRARKTTRSGPRSRRCAPAPAARCSPGQIARISRRCGACNWRRRRATASASCFARRRPRKRPRPRRCASGSNPSRTRPHASPCIS